MSFEKKEIKYKNFFKKNSEFKIPNLRTNCSVSTDCTSPNLRTHCSVSTDCTSRASLCTFPTVSVGLGILTLVSN